MTYLALFWSVLLLSACCGVDSSRLQRSRGAATSVYVGPLLADLKLAQQQADTIPPQPPGLPSQVVEQIHFAINTSLMLVQRVLQVQPFAVMAATNLQQFILQALNVTLPSLDALYLAVQNATPPLLWDLGDDFQAIQNIHNDTWTAEWSYAQVNINMPLIDLSTGFAAAVSQWGDVTSCRGIPSVWKLQEIIARFKDNLANCTVACDFWTIELEQAMAGLTARPICDSFANVSSPVYEDCSAGYTALNKAIISEQGLENAAVSSSSELRDVSVYSSPYQFQTYMSDIQAEWANFARSMGLLAQAIASF